jgi:predicted nucleic acid-binding Zn ribbon protein
VVTSFYTFTLAKPGDFSYSLPTMATYKTIYKCRECGATSYQQVIDRAQNGALMPTGQYRCTGCRNVFATIRSWWEPRRLPDLQSNSTFG